MHLSLLFVAIVLAPFQRTVSAVAKRTRLVILLVLVGTGLAGSAAYANRAADSAPDLVIVPLAVDRDAGTITLWLRDLLRLIQINNAKADEIERLRAACGGS